MYVQAEQEKALLSTVQCCHNTNLIDEGPFSHSHLFINIVVAKMLTILLLGLLTFQVEAKKKGGGLSTTGSSSGDSETDPIVFIIIASIVGVAVLSMVIYKIVKKFCCKNNQGQIAVDE